MLASRPGRSVYLVSYPDSPHGKGSPLSVGEVWVRDYCLLLSVNERPGLEAITV